MFVLFSAASQIRESIIFRVQDKSGPKGWILCCKVTRHFSFEIKLISWSIDPAISCYGASETISLVESIFIDRHGHGKALGTRTSRNFGEFWKR
jgi:hypothetical protein